MKTETGDQFGRPGAAMPFALPDAMLNAVISRSVWPPPARSDWPPFDTYRLLATEFEAAVELLRRTLGTAR